MSSRLLKKSRQRAGSYYCTRIYATFSRKPTVSSMIWGRVHVCMNLKALIYLHMVIVFHVTSYSINLTVQCCFVLFYYLLFFCLNHCLINVGGFVALEELPFFSPKFVDNASTNDGLPSRDLFCPTHNIWILFCAFNQ
jgi:hypothetical protein